MSERLILLVEDSVEDEYLILRELRRANVANRIDVVRDGQEALDFIFCEGRFTSRRGEALPTVVLLDLNLPKVSGLEVLERIRSDERTRRLLVVILTSSDADRDRLRGYDLHANGFVRKPVDFGEFATTAARLGVRWLAVNEPPPPAEGVREGRTDPE